MMRMIVVGSIAASCAGSALAQQAQGAKGAHACHASTGDWQAKIARGNNEPELIVTGKVVTSAGSWPVLSLGPTPWGEEPPRQIVILEIREVGTIRNLAVTTTDVRGRFNAPPHFGAAGIVIIQCKGRDIGRINVVHEPQ